MEPNNWWFVDVSPFQKKGVFSDSMLVFGGTHLCQAEGSSSSEPYMCILLPFKRTVITKFVKMSSSICIWVFPKIGGNTPKWMVKIMENPMKMDDLGIALFLDTPI